MFVSVLCACTSVCYMQNRALGSLKLELQTSMNCHVGARN